MTYLLEVLVWQKTKDATKKVPQHKPKMFVPDFMKQQTAEQKAINAGTELHEVTDIRDILSMPRV